MGYERPDPTFEGSGRYRESVEEGRDEDLRGWRHFRAESRNHCMRA